MRFKYNGQSYKTDVDANLICEDEYIIQIPGEYLIVTAWLESYPPQPMRITSLGELAVNYENSPIAVAQFV